MPISELADTRYTHITLYALGAAIPHALLLLHALLDVLPYPSGRSGVWYEMETGSVVCTDEIKAASDEEDEFAGIGAVEEDMPEMVERTKVSASAVWMECREKGERKDKGVQGQRMRRGEGTARATSGRRSQDQTATDWSISAQSGDPGPSCAWHPG